MLCSTYKQKNTHTSNAISFNEKWCDLTLRQADAKYFETLTTAFYLSSSLKFDITILFVWVMTKQLIAEHIMLMYKQSPLVWHVDSIHVHEYACLFSENQYQWNGKVVHTGKNYSNIILTALCIGLHKWESTRNNDTCHFWLCVYRNSATADFCFIYNSTGYYTCLLSFIEYERFALVFDCMSVQNSLLGSNRWRWYH